jgi:hypothetical protein
MPMKFNTLTPNAKSFIPLTLLMSSLLCVSTITHAGAWVSGQGQGYNKLAYSYYSADEFRGTNENFSEFVGKNTSYYGEYGLGNNFAVYGQLLYQDIKQTNAQGIIQSNSGFGDTELGIRYQWQANPFVLSTSFLVKVPYLYDEADELALGNGQEDYEFKVLLGKSLNEYGYFGVEFGYRLRTDAPSDEYRYLLEYGFNVTKQLYLRAKIDGVLSANNADEVVQRPTINNNNLLNTIEYDLGKLELTTGWIINPSAKKKYGIELTYTNEIYGENTLKGDSIQLGFTMEY